MTDLLPCPFCGGHARPMTCEVGVRGTMGHNKWVTITCSMCEINNGGKGGFMRPRFDTEKDAAKAWNTRAHQPIDVEKLKREVYAQEFVRHCECDSDLISCAIDHLAAHYNITKKGE